ADFIAVTAGASAGQDARAGLIGALSGALQNLGPGRVAEAENAAQPALVEVAEAPLDIVADEPPAIDEPAVAPSAVPEQPVVASVVALPLLPAEASAEAPDEPDAAQIELPDTGIQ